MEGRRSRGRLHSPIDEDRVRLLFAGRDWGQQIVEDTLRGDGSRPAELYFKRTIHDLIMATNQIAVFRLEQMRTQGIGANFFRDRHAQLIRQILQVAFVAVFRGEIGRKQTFRRPSPACHLGAQVNIEVPKPQGTRGKEVNSEFFRGGRGRESKGTVRGPPSYFFHGDDDGF